MFNLTVEIGDGGVIGKVNLGIDASKVVQNLEYTTSSGGTATIGAGTDWRAQVRYRGYRDASGGFVSVNDNVAFVNSDALADTTGLGIYSDLVTTGYIGFRDTVYAGNVYFIGTNTGIDGTGPQQNGAAWRDINGDYVYTSTSGAVTKTAWSNRQYGNLYFWGSKTPIVSNSGDEVNYNLSGINSLNLVLREDTGFESMTSKYLSNKLFTGTDNEMVVNYDSNIGNVNNWRSYAGAYDSHFVGSAGYDPIGSSLNSYLTVQDDAMDTVAEVRQTYLPSGVEAFEDSATQLDIASCTSLGSGNYYISSDGANTEWDGSKTYCLDHLIYINADNLTTPAVVLIDGVKLYLGRNTMGSDQACGFRMIGSGEEDDSKKVVFILVNGGQIIVGPNETASISYHPGIIDTHCFKTSDYYDITKLDQTTIPRFFIFGLDPNNNPGSILNCPVSMSTEKAVLTAFVGLYPQSTPRGGGGGVFGYGNTSVNTIYYGRISCGGFKYGAGDSLNIPYCPTIPSVTPNRPYAYRDNTDYSIVVEECGFYTA